MTRTTQQQAPRADAARAGSRASAEQGSATLELAVIAVGLLMLFGLLAAVGRIAQAQNAVEEAAANAARQASLARTGNAAQSAATTSALTTLRQQGLQCADLRVQVDTSAFGTRVGTAANVSATITCPLALADLALPGMPGEKVVTASWVSPLDTIRER
ncbi:TadE/TadG family type IV pilus assembly protein [Kineococcus sp. SYSU DK003]|uniref:TadE/TadG family type IV pilus assembly protein n=1 Tax=Kineococcus sp. SYSU DK003 TaxID=3383124 RepID=UPI003D7C7892